MTKRAFTIAVLSAAGTTAVWWLAWQGSGSSGHSFPTPAEVTPPARVEIDVHASLTALREAESVDQKLTAAARAQQIPIQRIPEILEHLSPEEKNRFGFAARVLLIRWASRDGAAAMDWAWQHLPDQPARNRAFLDGGASWAWHDPEGLARWAEEHYHAGPPHEQPPESTSPLLRSDQISHVCLWLAPYDPYLACTLRKKAGSFFSSQDVALVQAIPTVEKIKQALRAYDDLDQLTSGKISGQQFIPMQLLKRWQELDPEDFSASPYGHVMPTTVYGRDYLEKDDWKALTPEKRMDRANALISAKDDHGRAMGIYRISEQWSEVDLDGTISWLKSLPDSDAERKVSAISANIAPKDLPRALVLLKEHSPQDYHLSLVRAFDAWTKRHPGTTADLSGADETTRRIWSDLQSLEAP